VVIGGGIAGMQAALDIADAGYPVYLIERKPSIGGTMVQLSETFPTLDCPQCIIAPKMDSVLKHPNIKLLTNTEVKEISGSVGDFKVKLLRKPTYVDWSKCTGCGECAKTTLPSCPDGHDLSRLAANASRSPHVRSPPLAAIATLGAMPPRTGRYMTKEMVDRMLFSAEKCIHCAQCFDECVKENKDKNAITTVVEKLKDTLEQRLRRMPAAERRRFWQAAFARCIKCYACRDVCPVRTKELDDLESMAPRGTLPPPLAFHILRTYHLADRCISCGACEAACPAGIPLLALHNLIKDELRERFGYRPGVKVDKRSPFRPTPETVAAAAATAANGGGLS